MNWKLKSKVSKSFRVIDKFITQMEEAKQDSINAHNEAEVEIEELKSLQKDCDRIKKIADKILKVDEE